MIHPSTMAGPNWFTGSFGTTNPFQQGTTSFFRTPQFQGPQGGFGPGTNPFQSQQFGFGTNPMQIQNTISEVVRQTVPSILASCGIPGCGISSFQTTFGQPGQFGFQSPFGQPGTFGFQTTFGQPGTFGFQSPFGFQIPTGPAQFGPQFSGGIGDGQTQNYITAEVIRQCCSQVIQTICQQNPTLLSQITGGQVPFGGTWQQQQSFWNFCWQLCQTCCWCVAACLSQVGQGQGTAFGVPSAPFNFNTTTSQFGVTSGTPTGAGAF